MPFFDKLSKLALPKLELPKLELPKLDLGTSGAADWLSLIPEQVRDLVASHLPAGLRSAAGEAAAPTAPNGTGQFHALSFTSADGMRPYKLYVPAGYTGQPVPLVVMLHGCSQSPDDFAAGTGMNRAADTDTFLVVYPGQTSSANAQKCWNWFQRADQQRDGGEPALIAGITHQVSRDYAVDPSRIYVAGLSAGGAAAAIMGETYPELYAAVGVHSGLACGAARDMGSAMAAMHAGSPPRAGSLGIKAAKPTIVFHGDNDRTVHPSNADSVAAQAAPDAAGPMRTRTGRTESGHAYRCITQLDAEGRVVTEQWRIEGAGHAWSGGSTAGSYTDPRGPDATAEMLRFFREHPHATPA